VTHLLVTNDFPPKIGGIQSYLWELWRRLDPDSFAVLTARSHPAADAFDREQATRGIRIVLVPSRVLVPTPRLAARIRAEVERLGAGLVVFDPAFPLAVLGPRIGVPYAVVLHGAEVAVPGRVPVGRGLVAHLLRGSVLAVSAGSYPVAEARRALRGRGMPRVVEIPPGVDLDRFRPLAASEKHDVRVELGLPTEGPLVVSVSRLVPRKGMDVLIDAAVRLQPELPDLTVAIAGRGRDAERLSGRIAEHRAPVHLLGGLRDREVAALVGAADVFAMLCRNRWLGLEQEGFGIVFVEAAAAGVPQVAGDSGGAGEAVVDGVTGLVVRRPTHVEGAARAISRLVRDDRLRSDMAAASRRRAEASFDYDVLAPRLAVALSDVGG
jgi:phosphatidyl-myo-inositol dimannoside synthase